MKVIFFDGYCNLCSSFFRFVLRHDKSKVFHYKFLESEKTPETIVFSDEGRVYKRSAAVLKIFRDLPGLWKLFYGLIIIPPFIRDNVYRIIAKHRYRWFGRKRECIILTESEKQRFV